MNNDRLNAAITLLAERGIDDEIIAPPWCQIAWSCDMALRPPLFAPMWQNMLFMTLYWGIMFEIVFTLLLFIKNGNINFALLTGLTFLGAPIVGIGSALSYRTLKIKHKIPRWEELDSSSYSRQQPE